MSDEKSISDLMMQEPPMRYGATAVYKYKPSLERKFTFKSRFGDDVQLFRHERQENVLHLPRAVCPVGPFDMRDVGERVEFPKKPTPRPNQKELFEQTAAFLKMGLSGVVSAYTGWGKTVLGYHAAYTVGRKTLVITTKDDIYKQWYDGAKQFLGLDDWQVGEIRGDKCEVQGPVFCVAMIHSLSKDGKYPDWIGKGFGLVIFDECFHPAHELLTRAGWVPVAEVGEGDEVMAFDAKTSLVGWEPVLRTVERNHDGHLVRVEGGKFHTLTTPGHEQPIRRKRGEDWELARETLADLRLHSRVQLPIAGVLPARRSLEPWERLRIAFEADGHLLYTSKRTGDVTYRFGFRRERKVERLTKLLTELGLVFDKTVNARGDTNIVFKSKRLLTKDFAWFDPTECGACNQSFLLELVEWDGWCNDEGCFWEHGDEAAADRVQLIAQLCGFSASVRRYNDKWRVRWFKGQCWLDSGGCEREEVPYSGPVHCVTVPSGNVVTRLGKVVSISGNCHRVPAEQFSEVAFMFPAMLRLGLSASPKRADGKELLVQAHIGPIRAKTEAELMVPKVLRQETAWTCPRSIQFDPETHTSKVKRIPHVAGKTAHIEKMIAGDQKRNAQIASIVLDCFNKGRHLVVFSTLLDHLEAIKLQCVKLGLKASDTGMYVGTQNKAEKMAREAEKTRPIIFATYGMLGEGTSLDWLDTCLLAMPRSNVLQPVGRIRREYENKRPPVVIDLVDNDSPVFQSYARSRKKWYESIGAQVLDY